MAGLTRDELVKRLQAMDGLLLSDVCWIKDGRHNGEGVDFGQPQSFGTMKYTIHGAAWWVTKEAFPYQQICMALLATTRPMMSIQTHEASLTFPQMKEWLAATIEYAQNNDPWSPYLDGSCDSPVNNWVVLGGVLLLLAVGLSVPVSFMLPSIYK